MIFTVAIIAVLCSAPIASGVCPAQGNGTPEPAVSRYQQINADELTDPIARAAIQSCLNNISIGLHNYYLAGSCKQITELRPSLAYDSGYYLIQVVSGAVGVYCEMSTNNTFGQSGGWMRIANVDMRNNQSQCPPGLVYNVTEGRRLSQTKTCSRMLFNYIQYSGEWSTGRSVVK